MAGPESSREDSVTVDASTVMVEQQGAVAVLRWNRPEKLNAITSEMYSRMAAALRVADADPAIRAIVIAGSGRAFTAGNDLEDFTIRPPKGPDAPVMDFLRTLSTVVKPLIGAVKGAAVGVGTTLLLHCDLVYAADDARFALPFVKLGLCPEAGSSVLLPRLAGYQRAAEKLLFGEPFDAHEAKAMGFVNQIFTADTVETEAISRASRLATLPASALRATKSLMKTDAGQPIGERIALEASQFEALLERPAAKEALQAFAEKRAPHFTRID